MKWSSFIVNNSRRSSYMLVPNVMEYDGFLVESDEIKILKNLREKYVFDHLF